MSFYLLILTDYLAHLQEEEEAEEEDASHYFASTSENNVLIIVLEMAWVFVFGVKLQIVK